LLTELTPLQADKLGFNRNMGMEISLRLRFEDGFRHYKSIKEVLIHELAHMRYSEHNQDFHKFNRLLTKEVDELDWTKRGYKLGGAEVWDGEYQEEEDIMKETAKSSGQKLGGKVHNNKSLQELSYNAAITRLSQKEKEITDSCGYTKLEK